MIGEPAIEIAKTDDGLYTVTVTGWLEYNPLTNQTHSYEAKRIRSWSLDIAYDRSHFLAHEIHITHARRRRRRSSARSSVAMPTPTASPMPPA